MSTRPIVGIDLGTTFSCVSVFRSGRAELIPNPEGDHLTPSVVYFDPKNGEVSVGRIAEELSPQCPSNCLLDSKRFIGRQYDDDFVLSYIRNNQQNFSLVRGPNDEVVFEIEISNRRVTKKPEEVSAEVFKYLKYAASDYLGDDVTDAVISVPAYFSNAQRKATKRAAELAGFNVLKLITEPTAAAIHYVSDKQKNDSNILTFDFGGGTLDVSLIKVKNSIFEVKAVYGDTLLGGRDIDEILFQHFYSKLDLKNHKNNFLTRKFDRRLHNMCVNLKKNLSTRKEFTYTIDRYDGKTDLDISMTRMEFEEISKGIFKCVENIVDLCLIDSGVSKSLINEVVLVGGSTRIPRIKELLKSYFGPEKVRTDLNPDEAVAAGASIYAAYLMRDHQDLEKYKVTEVTPMSLGINSAGGRMGFFIPRNSPLPAEGHRECITTVNDQTTIKFSIYEGERKIALYNNKLGDFEVTDLPKKRAGDITCSIDFHLDEDGILNVTATEKSTGKTKKLVVTMGEFRLSDKKIKSSLADAKEHKIEDDVFEKFAIFKIDAQKQCRQILYDIKRIPLEKDSNYVKEKCEQFLVDSNLLDFTEIEKLEGVFTVFNNSVSSILKKYSMLQLKH
ncbi:heat shock 70 kDa protein [Anoplophora glabripennis]|uniref:heat shock 70 kDa protein n=1 Tax=Anoplophora glabripennis TaxID=217634 RepID=UPI0008742BD3|nr:heat shock 70 kDa protein [Anoplophora glabripennis]XP_018574289.1 heat shock 70 kDa protein [Anoplophora glabripennis]